MVSFKPSQGAPLVFSDVLTNVLFVFITCFDVFVLYNWMVVLTMLLIRSGVLKGHLSAQILVLFLLATLVAGMGFVDLSRQRG